MTGPCARRRHEAREEPTLNRKLLHTRKIDFQGYLREDGLFEMEARLQDITAGPTPLPFRDLASGDHIHDMRLVMTLDRELLIREVRAVTKTGATPFCAEPNAVYASLAGLRIGPGFKQKVKEKVGGIQGCTHLTELVNGLANAAMQTWFSVRRDESRLQRERDPDAPLPRPWVIGTCHAYREDGPAVKIVWPLHRRAA